MGVSHQDIPALKMPPELALSALGVLAKNGTPEERANALQKLRPDVGRRTLINAYVLPTLHDLDLFRGSLARGTASRFGLLIVEAPHGEARELMARQLVDIDKRKVHFVDWLSSPPHHSPRAEALRAFIKEKFDLDKDSFRQTLDRLTKWTAYLLHFNVLREEGSRSPRPMTISERHVTALATPSELPPVSEQRDALLDAYNRTSHRVGTKLYLPIREVRDALGREFEKSGRRLTDNQLDEVLTDASTLLKMTHVVSFSPFSGPAQGGLQVGKLYAGFISIRPNDGKAQQ